MNYIFKIILLTIACYLGGKVGLLFSITTEQAAALWPPAGIGLAALILCGYSYWPGIFLAAILTSLSHVVDYNFNNILVCVIIASGASIQAVISAMLVKRFLGTELQLTELSDNLKLLFWGGAVGSLISASIATTTLFYNGVISIDSAGFHAFNWWVGDVIGVVLFAPLCLVLFNNVDNSVLTKRRKKAVFISFLLAFVGMIYVFEFAKERDKNLKEQLFNEKALKITSKLQQQISSYLDVLVANEHFFVASNFVDRKEFKLFTKEFIEMHKGISGLSWIPRVENGAREAFVNMMKEQGFENYEVKKRYASNIVEKMEMADVHYPIAYSEPYERNNTALGFDVYARDVINGDSRRDALEYSRDTGKPVATERMEVVQAAGEYGFIIYNPVYKKSFFSIENPTIENRRDGHIGYVNGVFLFGNMMREVTEYANSLDMDIALYDTTTTNADKAFLYDSRTYDFKELADESRTGEWLGGLSKQVDVVGRKWALKFFASPSLATKKNIELRFVLLAELLFVSLFSMFILLVTGRSLVNEKAKDKAEAANQAKGDFLANMSHEQRTPLNSIIGLSRILNEEDRMHAEDKKIVGTINSASESLLKIVNDILDLSKVEEGKIVFEHRDYDLERALRELEQRLLPIAHKNGLTLDFFLDGFEKPYVKGDEAYLLRILTNLIGNALKYTLEGSVVVNVSLQHEDDYTYFMCDIIDTGVGIAENKIEYIFEKFAQAEESTTRDFGGTGLGLNITRKLVSQMNGEISVSSVEEEGSTFTVRIPMERADEDAREQIAKREEKKIIAKVSSNLATIPLSDARILIAEDHEFNVLVLSKMLERLGIGYFKIVSNGREAVKAFENDTFDMVIMDCHMPIMNGYEATEKIHEIQSKSNSDDRVPVIAMTADVMTGARERCLKSGMTDYIAKPVEETLLRYKLSNYYVFKEQVETEEEILASGSKVDGAALFDMSVLEQYSDRDPEQLLMLIDTFIEKSAADIVNISNQSIKGNPDSWYEAVHSLKGAASFVGAQSLVDLCVESEKAKDEGAEIHKKLYADIKNIYYKLVAQLKEAGDAL